MEQIDKERLFSKEYRHLFDRLYRYIRARVDSVHDAEDIVSEALLAGFRTLHTYDSEKGNLEQWCMGIARFRLIAYWKQNLPHLDLETMQEKIVDEGNDHHFQMDLGIAWEKIMGRIPREYHPLFTMKFAEGMTFEEIGQVVGKPSVALRQTFSRVCKKLRLHFVEEDFL